MVLITLAGVTLATLSAWRAHDMPLVVFGLVVLAVVGLGAIYLAARRP
jgi:hypothetical protein